MAFNIDNETLLNIGLAIAAIAFLLVLIYGINRLFKFIYKKIYSLAGDTIMGLSLKNYQFLTPRYTASLIVGGFKICTLLNCHQFNSLFQFVQLRFELRLSVLLI